jgi:glutaredoxin
MLVPGDRMTFRVPPDRPARPFRLLVPCLALLLLGTAAPAQAQYKVIGADGKVTYTDRAPNAGEGRVTALGARNAAGVPEVELPFELRQVASRYPVTLYVTSGTCEPCESGRALLRQRGIPYAEKQVLSAEDSEALEKLSGGRDAPTLTIGSQIVRGMASDLWNSYLDAAGYPRESKLPASYVYRPATPVVERREAAAPPRPPQRSVPEASPFERAPAPSGGIRF